VTEQLAKMYSRAAGCLVLAGCTLLAACNGGGGGVPGSGGGNSPLATPTFPLDDDPTPGTFEVVNAFPSVGFTAPLFLAGVPGEDRVVVVEQAGSIHAFDNDPAVQSTKVVLDISADVLSGGELGLLGLAFDPDFQRNRFVYLNYTAPLPTRTVISRFTWDETLDLIDPASEKILLEVLQPRDNHNAGMLAFGAQRRLLIALGDGGTAGDSDNNGQDQTTMLGSFLRVDPHPANAADPYDVPGDNPFVGMAGVVPEMWAFGFRNPFRFSVDRQTGTVWAGDVGQSQREEVDIVESAGNYGWRVYEGNLIFNDIGNTLPDDAFTFPILDYPRTDGFSVIGGYVYRGEALRSLHGAYVYGDFGTGNIWALVYDGTDVLSNDLIANVPSITSFGEDDDAELFVVSQTGDVFRLSESGAGTNDVPPATLSATRIFSDLASLTPANGFIEYGTNAPGYTDGAMVRRWFGIPPNTKAVFSPTGPWTFPVGSMFVQHLEFDLTGGVRGVETRVLVKRAGDMAGYSYRWRINGSNADLLAGGFTEDLALAAGGDLSHEYPARTDCIDCHNAQVGEVLGVTTRQLNRLNLAGTDNQLDALNADGFFTTDIGPASALEAYLDPFDAGQVLEERTRTYLAANCAQCHRPDGGTGVALDLRFDTANVDMNAIGVVPSAGTLGIAGARIIAAGSKETSVLWERMNRLDDFRMPPVARHSADTDGVDLVGQWIDSL
jgi:glucose/arabinose dehydrogenase